MTELADPQVVFEALKSLPREQAVTRLKGMSTTEGVYLRVLDMLDAHAKSPAANLERRRSLVARALGDEPEEDPIIAAVLRGK